VASDPIAGETRRINATTLVVELSQSLPVFTNVKLLFTFYQDAHCFSDIYAKVMERVESDHQPAYRLHVTYMDQHDAKVLERWVRAAAPTRRLQQILQPIPRPIPPGRSDGRGGRPMMLQTGD
jgi:hypothetical protein